MTHEETVSQYCCVGFDNEFASGRIIACLSFSSGILLLQTPVIARNVRERNGIE